MTIVIVAVGAVFGTATVLALVVWLVGLADAHHEAREQDAMRTEPPTLGGADRPRHYRRRPQT